jgi:CRP-like cAMP-binding protein
MSGRHRQASKRLEKIPQNPGKARPAHETSDFAIARDHCANRLLAALEPDDFQRLEPCLELASLSAGTILYEAGDMIWHAYFPHRCMISLVAVLQNGGSAEVATFGCEGVVGYASSLVSHEAFGRYVVQAAGTASRLPVEQLRAAADASPALRLLLRRFVEALLAQTLQSVACNAVHGVEARCCRWILSTHDRLRQDDLPLTHEFLAEMLGVQRSTLSLVARSLQKAGLISQHRGMITVKDRAGLEHASCECYGRIRRSFERLLPLTYSDA